LSSKSIFYKDHGILFEEVIGKIEVSSIRDQDEKFYKELWKTILSWKVGKGNPEQEKNVSYIGKCEYHTDKNEKGEDSNFIAIKEDISEKNAMLDDCLLQKSKLRYEQCERTSLRI
jgi:hypothetical protein